MTNLKSSFFYSVIFSTFIAITTIAANTQSTIPHKAITSEMNLAIINSQELVMLSTMGQEIRTKATSMEEKFHTELSKDEYELKKTIDDYKEKAPLMSQAARVSEENKIKELEDRYKNKARRMQEELNAFLQEEMTKLSLIIESEIPSFAEKSRFDVIFDAATGRIVYCKEELNTTSDLVAIVNNKTEQLAKEESKKAEKRTT